MKMYESRDIVYGFIKFNEWEREIINHPSFQRLRRIKQLALTDMVYPGASHTRFEHSLGVMHLATMIFDSIIEKRKDYMRSLGFDDTGLERDRLKIRFAALLHDIGHAPFSHSGENLMPFNREGKQFRHEDYSIAIIKNFFKDIIEDHPMNSNYGFKVEDITALLGDETVPPKRSTQIWKNLISSQLDADRADYLIRDSMHIGVRYGIFDQERLINTMSITEDSDTQSVILVITDGGWHVAESLLIARYLMFSQVYFHKTRIAYDHHVECAVKSILEKIMDKTGYFPILDSKKSLERYLYLDDWAIFGYIKDGLGEEHGQKIIDRRHDRCVFSTSEVPMPNELEWFDQIVNEYKGEITFTMPASKSWYKAEKEDIVILNEKIGEQLEFLSSKSTIVNSLKASNQQRRYAKIEDHERLKHEIDSRKKVWV